MARHRHPVWLLADRVATIHTYVTRLNVVHCGFGHAEAAASGKIDRRETISYQWHKRTFNSLGLRTSKLAVEENAVRDTLSMSVTYSP